MKMRFFIFFFVFVLIQSTFAQKRIPYQVSTTKSTLSLDSTNMSGKLTYQVQSGHDVDGELAWYYPAATPGYIGQYEKLEIGVSIDSLTENQIENFTQRRKGQRTNPFNPEEIDVYAEFWCQYENQWYGPIRVNGFYFQPFDRLENTWDKQENEHPFRIRFTPEYTGTWRCRISAKSANAAPIQFEEFTFTCLKSEKQGFVRVGDNKRYLRVGNDPFFPVGQNLTGPNNPSHTLEWGNKTAGTKDYLSFQASMTELAAAGGNYFRYIVSPWQTEIEFEELGNYSARMSNAWEFDQIIEHAEDLDLKIHLNLAMHYTFESPSGYAMTDWDWSARGDSLCPLDNNCFKKTDKGYCYRNELDLEKPIEFLTDSMAIVFYKRRLRYMVARWGYSTSIGVMELMSEVNNFGNEAILELHTINGNYGCYNMPDPDHKTDHPYKDYPEKIIPDLMSWQLEMCRFMKEDLGVKHPLAVSYTGEPDFQHGDSTYYSPYVDIATFNHYGLSLDKFVKNYVIITSKYHTETSGYYLDKPFMHSEYGPGGSITNCDQGIRYLKTINLTPFSGLAGSGINWHFHWNEDSSWNYLGPVRQLMEGIPLDAENWQPAQPIVFDDNSLEIMYLERPQVGGMRKAVGVISNRSFNFYTQGLDLPGADCKDDSIRSDIKNTPIYRTPTAFEYNQLSEKIKLPAMGSSNGYMVEWTNALTGEIVGKTKGKSTIWGRLELEYPGSLTGNFDSPILFFKLYPEADTFFSTPDSLPKSTTIIGKLPLATYLQPIEITNWK